MATKNDQKLDFHETVDKCPRARTTCSKQFYGPAILAVKKLESCFFKALDFKVEPTHFKIGDLAKKCLIFEITLAHCVVIIK